MGFAYLDMMWHDLDIVRNVKPSFRSVEQKVLRLAGVHVCVLVDVIRECWFLTSVCDKCSSERSVEHLFHCVSCFLSRFVQLIQERMACLASLIVWCSRVKSTEQFLDNMEFCLNQSRRNDLIIRITNTGVSASSRVSTFHAFSN